MKLPSHTLDFRGWVRDPSLRDLPADERARALAVLGRMTNVYPMKIVLVSVMVGVNCRILLPPGQAVHDFRNFDSHRDSHQLRSLMEDAQQRKKPAIVRAWLPEFRANGGWHHANLMLADTVITVEPDRVRCLKYRYGDPDQLLDEVYTDS